MGALLIVGAGGHGKVAADAALSTGKWDDVVFLDDAWPEKKENGPWRVDGKAENFEGWRTTYQDAIVTVGDNRLRLKLQYRLTEADFQIVSVIHPSAQVSRFAKIGTGSVVFANAVINMGTVIGEAAIINTAATIDHDCQLGSGVHVSPGAHLAGGVLVGDFSWIGIGGVVRQLITIGSDVVVAAGAVVVSNIPDGLTVMGIPARSKDHERRKRC